MSKVVLSRRVDASPDRQLSLKDFYEARNRVLILRAIGGLGDILMHRMMFEDIKMLMPDCEVHFACPKLYHDAVIDHPYVDAVVDSWEINKYSYVISYNTSTICGRYELKVAPLSDLHRSDIWATHCGFTLTRHDMHIRLSEDEKKWARQKISEVRDRDGAVVLVSPISAMENKNLMDFQQEALIKGLWDRGLCPIGLHTAAIIPFSRMEAPTITRITIRQWMALINESDYVISVDTAALHCAGGLHKPLVGIFTFATGTTYSKYYPTAQIIQGPCPVGHQGCYNWCNCPVKKKDALPCLTGITGDMLLAAVDTMLHRRENVTKDSTK